MMQKYKLMFFLFAFSILGNISVCTASDQPYKITPNELKWVSDPSLPKDVKIALVFGDPTKNIANILRVKIPAGGKIAPHTHPMDENVTILSGSLHGGVGKQFDQNKGLHLSAGSFISFAANMPHYAWCTEETILQVNINGPWAITYINPKDDPRNQ